MQASYHLDVLPNGLRLATAEMPYMASVSVGLWAGVGSRHENSRLGGAAHFLEHLLFKGTKRRSARQISGEVEGMGGYLDAYTSEDHTCYYAKAEASHLPRLGDVLADLYQHSRLPAAEVERERNVIREEILMYRDQPAQVAEEMLAQAIWPTHPLGRPLAGTLESVSGLRREQLVDFWRAGYHARTTVLAVAGLVRREDALAALTPLFAGMPGGRAPRFTRWRKTAGVAPRIAVDCRDCEQTQLALGFLAPGRHDPARYAARALSAILGEKMNSRLFQSLRERRGLCYSVQSETAVFDEVGLLNISLGLEARRLRESLGLIRREITRLCNVLVGRAELQEARGYLIGQHRLGLESTTNQMMWLGESLLGHGRIVDPDEVRRGLEGVTAAAVREAAQKILRAGFRALVAVGPVKDDGPRLLGWFGG